MLTRKSGYMICKKLEKKDLNRKVFEERITKWKTWEKRYIAITANA